MNRIKNIELLPKFFDDVKKQYGIERLSDRRFVISVMSDLIPGAVELKRCMYMAYESGAMASVIEILSDQSNAEIYINKAFAKLISYTYMDKQHATTIIDSVVTAVCPEVKSSNLQTLIRLLRQISYLKKNICPDAKSENAHQNVKADELYNIGIEYLEKKDFTRSFEYLNKAAEHGHAKAQNSLGDCYYYGNGVNKDYTQAVKWYRKAAEQGFTEAQYHLGKCYNNGEGVHVDFSQAAEWYHKAAEQGLAKAQVSFGDCYYFGLGVKKDYALAMEWYSKAAEQGYNVKFLLLLRPPF